MRIYISGPMTGKPDFNHPAFNAAAIRLREEGHFVINPAELSAFFGTVNELAKSFDYQYFSELERTRNRWYEPTNDMRRWTRLARALMDADRAAVRSCDAIYLLRGWESSRGAKKELQEAIAHGLKIIQEE